MPRSPYNKKIKRDRGKELTSMYVYVYIAVFYCFVAVPFASSYNIKSELLLICGMDYSSDGHGNSTDCCQVVRANIRGDVQR